MTLSEIIFLVSQRGIRLWVENRTLRYRAPKGALTVELRKLLTEHKDSIVAYLDEESGRASYTYPLSYNQQFLWFLYHHVPQSSAYNVAFVARVVSPVDFSRMEATFQKLVDRHPMLRATYDSKGGVPSMRIHSRLDITCEHIDATGWSEEALHREVHQRYCEPFDLAKGPILRVQLFTCDPEDHVLLLTIHHIACDGWSIGILLKEFCDLYPMEPGINLPAGGAPYTDFIRYQAGILKGPEGERLRSFWKQQLAGELPELNLPVDKQRPRTRFPCGGTHHFSITGDLYRSIVSFARSSGATLYTFLLASFQALLMRYSSDEEILIGTPMASRPRKEDELTVGCYINPIVLRGTISADSTFEELLRRTRKTFTDAFEHRHYPFPLLVEQLSPARDPSKSPIFQVMFNFLNRQTLGEVANLLYRDKSGALAGESVGFGDLKMRPFAMDQEEGQLDLALEIIDNNHSLTGLLKYSTDLYEEGTIARMASHFEILLQGIVSHPKERLSELPLLTAEERHQILVEWNATEVDYPKDKCLHEVFEGQVERTPDSVALGFETKYLSYRELNERANQLGRFLRSLGVGPEVLVGVYVERSIEMVIALYGILKAGGAYVPLDPEYPDERVRFMIEDSQLPVLLTQEHLAGKVPGYSGKVVCLDSEWGVISRESADNLESGATADNLAYVIYTSGSTGKPKGVMNTHRGICNRLLWMQEAYPLTGADRVLQKTTFSFDVSVWEFFWPLLFGARLVIAQPGGHRDSAYLVDIITKEGITTLHFVPSMLQIFLEEEGAEKCRSIRRVICSGEALPYKLQMKFFERLDTELHNLYGPTEAAVDVTYWPCQRDSSLPIVPIGRPVANTQTYILNGYMQPVPIGVCGELHIGGVQVARGYLNRPELTAEKFIPDLFSTQVGAMLYKTGDLCRYLPDGNIEYLGRNDFQIKIRGLRIEIGEIEAVLTQHPEVREAVVVAREDVPGDKRLVAYLTGKQKTEINPDKLREFLKVKLPVYMVPAAFVQLETFPLTGSGKVDRRALPAPKGGRQTEKAYEAPKGRAEQIISKIWQEILEVEEVGIHDNFFDLGGHSLLLVRMRNRLEEHFEKEISIVDMFQRPTIQDLAKFLSDEQKGEPSFDRIQERARKQKEILKRRRQVFERQGDPNE